MSYRMTLAQWNHLADCLERKGATYYFKPGPGNNDGFIFKTGSEEGLTKYHIHSIEHVDDNDMVFEKLLAKSSNWRDGQEPDLATAPMEDWRGLCQGMDSSVLMVVDALRECFEALGAQGPQ